MSAILRLTTRSLLNQMGNQLLDAAMSLRAFHERGRVVPEFRLPELREIIFRSYRIIYRINSTNQSVEIVRFWHGARGFPRASDAG